MEAKQYAARNRQGSDWFTHDSTVTPAPVQKTSPTTAAPPAATSPTDRTQPIKPSSDSNQWYKYDGASTTDKPAAVEKSSPKEAGPPAVAEQPAAGITAADKPAGNGQHVELSSAAGDALQTQQHQRGGTASDWFSHDHSDGSGENVHVRGTSKELGANAARMRGESEQWFSHDSTSAAPTSPVHAAKGRAGARPGNSDMHDVFHHSGN
jgi:hypothetical protein